MASLALLGIAKLRKSCFHCYMEFIAALTVLLLPSPWRLSRAAFRHAIRGLEKPSSKMRKHGTKDAAQIPTWRWRGRERTPRSGQRLM